MTTKQIDAVRELEQVVRQTFRPKQFGSGQVCERLFDPTTMPSMYERADAVTHRLHTDRDIEYVERGADADDPAALFAHFVSEPHNVFAFGNGHQMAAWLRQYAWPRDRCNTRIAPACVDGYTLFLPLQRGRYLVLFEACPPCIDCLFELHEGGDILAEVDAEIAFERVAKAAAEKWRAIRGGAR